MGVSDRLVGGGGGGHRHVHGWFGLYWRNGRKEQGEGVKQSTFVEKSEHNTRWRNFRWLWLGKAVLPDRRGELRMLQR